MSVCMWCVCVCVRVCVISHCVHVVQESYRSEEDKCANRACEALSLS